MSGPNTNPEEQHGHTPEGVSQIPDYNDPVDQVDPVEQAEQQAAQGEGQAQGQGQAPASNLDEERLIQVAVRAAQQAQQPSGNIPSLDQGSPNRQLSEVELKKLMNHYDASAEELAELFNVDSPEDITPKRVQLFNSMMQKFVKQAVTMSAAYQHRQIEPLQQMVQTQQQLLQAQQEQRYEQEITKLYPELGDPKIRELVILVKNKLVTSGKRWNSLPDFARDLHTQVNGLLKQAGGSLPTKTAGTRPAQKPATGSLGGSTGAGGGGKKAAGENPQVAEIWG